MNISETLRKRLSLLQTDSGVRFDRARKCFVDCNGRRVRGITRILEQLIPVAGDTATIRRSRARQSKNDAVIVPRVERFAGRTMARCSTCAVALEHARQSQYADKIFCGETDDAKAHGMLVDYQLTIYAERGGRDAMFRRCVFVDPCVATLLEQLDRMHWTIVATQLPLYSASMDAATACDLICTDLATRVEMNLIEVKASMKNTQESSDNYVRIRGRNKGTALRGIPQSYLSRHQGQLLCTNHMVKQKFGFQFENSCIMRVSPGLVHTFDLHAWYVAKLPKFIDAIALKTGKRRRAKKLAAALRVQKIPRQRKKKSAPKIKQHAQQTPKTKINKK